MAKLKPGAIAVDLETGGIYGDLDHCPIGDLLESAEALLACLPEGHKGVKGFCKDYDAGCYVFAGKSCKVSIPEHDIYRGPGGGDPILPQRPASVTVTREFHLSHYLYEPLIGSVRDGKVSTDTEGIVDLHAKALKEQEQRNAEYKRKAEESKEEMRLRALEREANKPGGQLFLRM